MIHVNNNSISYKKELYTFIKKNGHYNLYKIRIHIFFNTKKKSI